jgi:hypothetical protein
MTGKKVKNENQNNETGWCITYYLAICFCYFAFQTLVFKARPDFWITEW